jgi:tryptophanyl-tRNA synthetase
VFFFVANLHALTTLRDRQTLRDYSFGIVLDYLALGLDPEQDGDKEEAKAHFRQALDTEARHLSAYRGAQFALQKFDVSETGRGPVILRND